MAPILAKSIVSYHGFESKIPRPAQSKIPIRKLRTETSKSKATSAIKPLSERTLKPSVVKPSVIGKSLNGRTNIIKPIIKKSPPAKDLGWTKSSGASSVSRKSITKAKDRREKVLKQSKLTIKQTTLIVKQNVRTASQKNVDAKPAQGLIGKENKEPNVIISHEEPPDVALPSDDGSMIALQDKLNLEFVPNEFFRNQILNNKALSFTQLKAFSPTPTKQNAYSKSLVKGMQRMTIASGSKLRGSATKGLSVMGSAKKYGKKSPLSAKKYGKKSPLCSKKFSQAVRRCTWTPGVQSQTKPKVDPYQEAMNSIRRLSEKKSRMTSSNSRARVALFQSSNNSFCQSPDVSRRVTWAEGKQALVKKMDPYEEAICSIKKMSAKKQEPTPSKEERRNTWAAGKQSSAKQLDPYEIAMAKIKELKMKASAICAKSSPAVFTPLKTPLKVNDSFRTPIQRAENGHKTTPASRRSLFASDSEISLKHTSTPEHSTPRHVSFNLTPNASRNIYRPLKEFLTKSILKKQARLTDISEHSENDTTRSSQSSEKMSDVFPPNKFKKSGSLGLKFDAVEQASPIPLSTSSKITFDSMLSPKDRSFEGAVVTPYSRNSSLPPSSKQRRLTPASKNHSSPAFAVNHSRFPHKSNVSITNFLPSVNDALESPKSPSVKEPSPTPIYTPKALSFHSYSSRQLSPDEFLKTCSKSTPLHDAPICTPLVLKSMARSHKNKALLSPIKQKLDFEEMKDEEPVKPSKDEFQWTPRHSVYTSSIMTKSKRDDLLADKECERIMEKQNGLVSKCRDLLNPIAKTLTKGDKVHFLPVLPEYDE